MGKNEVEQERPGRACGIHTNADDQVSALFLAIIVHVGLADRPCHRIASENYVYGELHLKVVKEP